MTHMHDRGVSTVADRHSNSSNICHTHTHTHTHTHLTQRLVIRTAHHFTLHQIHFPLNKSLVFRSKASIHSCSCCCQGGGNRLAHHGNSGRCKSPQARPHAVVLQRWVPCRRQAIRTLLTKSYCGSCGRFLVVDGMSQKKKSVSLSLFLQLCVEVLVVHSQGHVVMNLPTA